MKNIRPTIKERENGIEDGWSGHALDTGYEIFNFDGLNLFQIEEVCAVGNFTRYIEENGIEICADELAAIQAETDGYCKIIPVNELPITFNRRYFGWVDTPKNRKAIQDYCDEIEASLILYSISRKE